MFSDFYGSVSAMGKEEHKITFQKNQASKPAQHF